SVPAVYLFFFFLDPPTSEIYTLSLHDALPISCGVGVGVRLQDFEQQILDHLHARHGAAAVERAGYRQGEAGSVAALLRAIATQADRKSTRLNSSHLGISYAVFCLKKKTT